MKQISAKALKDMMDSRAKFILLDARGHEAFNKEHIPGAISVPSDHLGEHVVNGFGKDETLVAYCSGWTCEASTIAAEKLTKYGFKDVLEFKGGLEDWKNSGYPTQKGH